MSDVLVIGAGPAGATVARLLGAWGHSVDVITGPGSDAERLAESIPASANKALRAIGAIDEIQNAGFLPWRGNTVWWGGEDTRIETFPAAAPGYQVLRRDFDRRMRAMAEKTPGVVFAKDDSGSSVRLPESYRFVVDASGRAGVLARERGLRIQDPSKRTIAIAGTWQRDDPWSLHELSDETHTLVASYAGGWAWSVPVDRLLRQFTVMIDPSRSGLARGSSSREIYLAEIAKVEPLQKVLEGARLIDAPWGADASEYTARQYAGPGFVLAGDAGSAINPLSSFGVKKALVSGWLAAIAVHTALVNPAMEQEALAFFDRRERAVAAAAALQASKFASDAARAGQPFWLARAAPSYMDTAIDDFGIEPDAVELGREPDVLRAFEDLRMRDSIRLVKGRDVSIEPRPAVRGREIVMDEQLAGAFWPAGLRYLRGVDLVWLVRTAPSHRDVGELFTAARALTPGIDLPDFLGALSVLIARGGLRHEL